MRLLEQSLVEARLETLCGKGCQQVRRDIAALESGLDLPETEGLTASEKTWILSELKQIMAVYGDACRVD